VKKNKGFTMMELTIVLAILVPSFLADTTVRDVAKNHREVILCLT